MSEITALMVREIIEKVDYIITLYKKHEGIKNEPEICWPERWNEGHEYEIRVHFRTGCYIYNRFYITPEMLTSPKAELAALFRRRKNEERAYEREMKKLDEEIEESHREMMIEREKAELIRLKKKYA